jgi:hypothetical protein
MYLRLSDKKGSAKGIADVLLRRDSLQKPQSKASIYVAFTLGVLHKQVGHYLPVIVSTHHLAPKQGARKSG